MFLKISECQYISVDRISYVSIYKDCAEYDIRIKVIDQERAFVYDSYPTEGQAIEKLEKLVDEISEIRKLNNQIKVSTTVLRE